MGPDSLKARAIFVSLMLCLLVCFLIMQWKIMRSKRGEWWRREIIGDLSASGSLNNEYEDDDEYEEQLYQTS